MQQLLPKNEWGINDPLVINGKHGTIKEFSANKSKVYVEHRDNENQSYVRWYEASELPPYPIKGEPFLPPVPTDVQETPVIQAPEGLQRGAVLHHRTLNYNRIIESVDGLTLTLALGAGKVQWDSSIYEIRKPDEGVMNYVLNHLAAQNARVTELEAKVMEQGTRLASQSVTIASMMKSDEAEEPLQDKLDQLEDDFAELQKERDKLLETNKHQSELLKQAAAPTPIETRLSSIEARLEELTETVIEAKVLAPPPPAPDGLMLFLQAIQNTINAPTATKQEQPV